MKMLSKQGCQIVIPTQFAHDLGDRQCGKGRMGLQAQRQQITSHLDQQGCIQPIPLQLHGANMEDRFEDLPETFDQMMLLPHVPDFSTTHRIFTEVHQIGYPFNVGQLAYHCHRSKTSGMLATERRGLRGMKPLRYIGVPP